MGKKALSQALREAREARGLSQEAAARALGTSQAALSLWESGTRAPHLRSLQKIAKLYRLDLAELAACRV